MKLSGKQVQEISDALLAGYGSVDALRIMVRLEFNEKLDEIAGGENLRVLVFNLITWAELHGRVNDLIQGAYRHNQGNPALQRLAHTTTFQDPQIVADDANARPAWSKYLLFGAIGVLTAIVGFYSIQRLSTLKTTVLPTTDLANATPTAQRTAGPIAQPTVPPAESTLTTITPPLAVGATRTNLKDGAVYVYVPAGSFIMGSSDDDALAADNEKPQQAALDLDAFWIMQTEVTNAQYARCVAAGACSAPEIEGWSEPARAEHPVTYIDWYQANEYAEWAGGRLPTEAEWQKACRGPDGRIYPWGSDPPTKDLANFADYVGDTQRVGNYPNGASHYGVLDMAGNVFEWTASKYAPYPYVAGDGREDSEGDEERTVLGGAWTYNVRSVRCALRDANTPDLRFDDVGFRLVSPES